MFKVVDILLGFFFLSVVFVRQNSFKIQLVALTQDAQYTNTKWNTLLCVEEG